jgi:hypothetical protein
MKHPIQPLEIDSGGVLRFKRNAIVDHVLDAAKRGGVDLNSIACGNFSQDDRNQFAQLIGYSVCGFAELSYHDPDVLGVLDQLYNEDGSLKDPKVSERDARIAYLEGELKALKDAIREPMARLFQKHPDDLA